MTAIHEINSRYGHAVFEKGFTISHHQVLLYFLNRRISRHPESYRTKQAIKLLLKRYVNLAETSSRRYLWTLLPVAARWDCIRFYGCKNTACPERQELLVLKGKRRRGSRDPVVEERLFKWGGQSKACSRYVVPQSLKLGMVLILCGSCKQVSYCSVECQKAHWKMHKADCKKNTPKDQADIETEI